MTRQTGRIPLLLRLRDRRRSSGIQASPFIRTIRELTGGKPYPVVLPVPETQKAQFERLIREFLPEMKVTLVHGGRTRTESVCNALKALPPEVGVAAVHDAARPLVTHAVLTECVEAALIYGGAVSARPQTDTMKETDENGVVVRTVPRDRLWSVQTPQVFRREPLEKACAEALRSDRQFTDDAAVMEAFTDVKIQLVRNPDPNPKLTYPEDLKLIERLAGAED